MRHKSILVRYFGKFLVTLLSSVFILLISISCSSSDPDLQVAGFRFTYEGNNYYIKSIYCPNSPKSCNHLISNDFEALDINQDRVIDKIIRGDATIAEAQRIYSYALNLLEEENRLSAIKNNTEEFIYTITKLNIHFEITSFTTEVGDPFNQFRVVQNRFGKGQDISLFNDLKADGTLDEKLTGSFSLFEAQNHYQETIDEGIGDNKISKVNNLIRVQ